MNCDFPPWKATLTCAPDMGVNDAGRHVLRLTLRGLLILSVHLVLQLKANLVFHGDTDVPVEEGIEEEGLVSTCLTQQEHRLHRQTRTMFSLSSCLTFVLSCRMLKRFSSFVRMLFLWAHFFCSRLIVPANFCQWLSTFTLHFLLAHVRIAIVLW